jgi:putative ABC transport system permease protein
MIRALDRKLLRDLWGMKGQALAIALVISSGVATFIMSRSTLDSLKLTQSAFYEESRFAEVFASLKRAPESLRVRIESIPGVQQAQTLVVAAAKFDLEDYPDPVAGQIISIPDHDQPLLNQLYLRRGRLVAEGRDTEVIVSDSFADAHGLQPGSHLDATINGKRRRFEIVGVAISPEYIFQQFHTRLQKLWHSLDGQDPCGERLRHGGRVQSSGSDTIRRHAGG